MTYYDKEKRILDEWIEEINYIFGADFYRHEDYGIVFICTPEGPSRIIALQHTNRYTPDKTYRSATEHLRLIFYTPVKGDDIQCKTIDSIEELKTFLEDRTEYIKQQLAVAE